MPGNPPEFRTLSVAPFGHNPWGNLAFEKGTKVPAFGPAIAPNLGYGFSTLPAIP